MILNPRLGESIELVELLRRVGWRSELRLEPLDDMLLDEVERMSGCSATMRCADAVIDSRSPSSQMI
jgi:hypothetical protein